MSINNENKKLIKEFNARLIQKIRCEIFQLEYKYGTKELHLVQVTDTGVISKNGKRLFREVKREVVLNNDPGDEDMYLYLRGMLAMIHIMDVHIKSVTASIKNAPPMQKH